MKAIVQNDYGSPDVLKLREVAKPMVEENDVLASVHAAALNAGDYFSMRGSPWAIRFSLGIPRPKDYILGWDVAGQVEAVGKKVKLFASTVVEENGTEDVPGRILRCKEDKIHVQSGRGIVGIREIQYPGKKRLPVSDFLRGFSLSEGTILGE